MSKLVTTRDGHRIEVIDEHSGAISNFDWSCSCGRHGRVASRRISYAITSSQTHTVEEDENA